MPDFPGANHVASECLANRLVSEANAKDGQIGRRRSDQLKTDPGLVRCARPGRQQYGIRLQAQGVRCRQIVVADHMRPVPQFLDVVNEVPGEAVIVVDHQDHWSNS